MFLRTLACLVLLSISANPAVAQTLDDHTEKSAFIKANIKYLIQKRAVSVYASTKPYCPTFFWWSNRASASQEARRNFRKDLTRRMETAGFSAAAIDHCVQNSGFVVENGRLMNHPKNKVYTDLVQPAVMVVRNKSTGEITKAPVLFETNSFDNKQWRIFDQRFKRICTLGNGKKDALPMKCAGFGSLIGRFANEGNRRKALELRSSKYDILIMTQRPVSYVTRQHSKRFK